MSPVLRPALTAPKTPITIMTFWAFSKSDTRFFYIDADAEMPVKAALEFADEIGAISAYAYLGDVAQSVTGDKRAQSFDSYLDELFSIISELGLRAVTYMPSRNTEEQLGVCARCAARYALFR